ncbi:MAG: GPR endopeptidase [Clostridiales bacterium]|nr:GPR endopeptidase [Clostridiales bacterium]
MEKNDADIGERYAGLGGFAPTLDLANEAHSLLRGKENKEIDGDAEQIEKYRHAKVVTITIKDERGAKIMGKPIGRYVTIEAPDIRFDKNLEAEISAILAERLRQLLPPPSNETILLIGLGNDHATPDSLGPSVVDYTIATRHIKTYSPEVMGADLAPICVLAPGVLGITGIETAEIIKGVVAHVKPKCIIAVDSLAAASINRVSTSIQIADTGINPGSGVGNKRVPINEKTMGAPVVAIGVPTVVNTTVIIFETLSALVDFWEQEGREIPRIDEKTLEFINGKLLSSFKGSMIVTPKEIDQLIQNIARIIAAGIAQAVHPCVNKNNYHLYIQ